MNLDQQEITGLVGELVAEIDTTIKGKYNSLSGETDYCNTKWARAGRSVFDVSGNEFMVDFVNTNESLTVTQIGGTPTPLDGVTTLATPFHLVGTRIAANNEWKEAKDDLNEKTPFVWLLDNFTVTKGGRKSSTQFEVELRIFFLDQIDVVQGQTRDHREQAVFPMEQLAESFLDVVRSKPYFKRFKDYRITSFSRFGVTSERGVLKNIIDANLSGVQLQFTLARYKSYNCKNC